MEGDPLPDSLDPPPAEPVKGQRGRSYPNATLAEALGAAEKLWERAKRSFVTVPIACGYWGYSSTGSTGLRFLAAVVAYGLVDETGSGASRQIKLSDLGYELVRNPNKTSPEYRQRLLEAALKPPILQEVYDSYAPQGELPPDDQALAWDLENKFKVHTAGLRPLIAVLRANFALAGAFDQPTMAPDRGGAAAGAPAANSGSAGALWNETLQFGKPTAPSAPSLPAMQGQAAQDGLSMAAATAPGTQLRDQPLTLLSAGDAVLRYPHPMTEEDFEWLLETLKRLKKKLVFQPPPPPPPPFQPGDLVQWESQGTDQFPSPRRVNRIQDGHVFVEGSETGIPIGQVRRA